MSNYRNMCISYFLNRHCSASEIQSLHLYMIFNLMKILNSHIELYFIINDAESYVLIDSMLFCRNVMLPKAV